MLHGGLDPLGVAIYTMGGGYSQSSRGDIGGEPVVIQGRHPDDDFYEPTARLESAEYKAASAAVTVFYSDVNKAVRKFIAKNHKDLKNAPRDELKTAIKEAKNTLFEKLKLNLSPGKLEIPDELAKRLLLSDDEKDKSGDIMKALMGDDIIKLLASKVWYNISSRTEAPKAKRGVAPKSARVTEILLVAHPLNYNDGAFFEKLDFLRGYDDIKNKDLGDLTPKERIQKAKIQAFLDSEAYKKALAFYQKKEGNKNKEPKDLTELLRDLRDGGYTSFNAFAVFVIEARLSLRKWEVVLDQLDADKQEQLATYLESDVYKETAKRLAKQQKLDIDALDARTLIAIHHLGIVDAKLEEVIDATIDAAHSGEIDKRFQQDLALKIGFSIVACMGITISLGLATTAITFIITPALPVILTVGAVTLGIGAIMATITAVGIYLDDKYMSEERGEEKASLITNLHAEGVDIQNGISGCTAALDALTKSLAIKETKNPTRRRCG